MVLRSKKTYETNFLTYPMKFHNSKNLHTVHLAPGGVGYIMPRFFWLQWWVYPYYVYCGCCKKK